MIAGPGFNGGSAYQHDARPLNANAIRVVFGDNGQIRVVDVSPLANPQPIPVLTPASASNAGRRSYSCRRAIIGSMREARRAGTNVASAAMPTRISETTTAVGM